MKWVEKKIRNLPTVFSVQFLAGCLAYMVCHEGLLWLLGRTFGWEPRFGVDRIRGIPLIVVTRYRKPVSGTARILAASYTPLVLIPVGYENMRLGFFWFGLPFVVVIILNLPFETKYTISNLKEARRTVTLTAAITEIFVFLVSRHAIREVHSSVG